MEVEIQGLTHDGQGVGRTDGKVCFVPRVLPGERAEIEIISDKKKYREGKLLKLLTPSNERITPACCHFQPCGGCAFQHVSYEAELRIKQEILKNQLQKIGGLAAPPLLPILPSPSPQYYRNKVTWQIDYQPEIKQMGFYSLDHKTLLNIDFCQLISRPLLTISEIMREFLAEAVFQGKLIIREGGGKFAVMIQADRELDLNWPDFLRRNSLLSSLSVWVEGERAGQWGEKYLTHTLGDLTLYDTPECFFQVNNLQTPILYQVVESWADITKDTHLLDAYCGVGSIALWLAKAAGLVVGIENNRTSVQLAKLNAAKNKISNALFYADSCEQEIINALTEKHAIDTVIFDPPRSGLKPQVIAGLAKNRISTVIYVSCNPATLARDLKRFQESGYHLANIQPVDMFPRTYHIETVCLMSRVSE